ncbi:MAG TPA: 2Fe-2S iron-sulfur cluster-binding protein, partial [Planctomycetota bacterium]|nr:2Fe-2S iron-sulfur cluster-binding protein [Planctomycetota bacterium]
MTQSQHRVTFQPQGRTVSVLSRTTILEAAASAGLVIDTPCGGAGACGKCRLQVAQGAAEPSDADRQTFTQIELQHGWRLACQNRVSSDMVIHVPDASLFGDGHQIVKESAVTGPADVFPAIRKLYVELPPPTLEDSRPDLLRLEATIGAFKTDLGMLRRIPKQLRAQAFRGTAVLSDHRLIDFEPGDTSGHCFGVAVDVGTTTIAASLMNLCSGQELGVGTRMNPQVSFGDDVLSRIKH